MRRIRSTRAFRGRRRKQKYTWLPTLGGLTTDGNPTPSTYGTSYFSGVVQVNTAALGPTDLYVTPIVPDASFFVDEASEQGLSLRDLTEGQDWLLKRIVGKLFINIPPIVTTVGQNPYIFTVGAGFFVGRADDTNPNIPDTNNAEIDPLGSRNIRQPWIWRRTWLLRNSGAPPPTVPMGGWGVADSWLAGANVYLNGGSEKDGPHIDSKIARRIRREERLWFVLNAYGKNAVSNDIQVEYAGTSPVEFTLDYRILGQMRRSTNKSTF